MERQAKDGTIFEQIGQDQWKPVTRTAKDGTVFKKVGNDQWSPLEVESEEQDSPLSAFVAKAANSALLGYAPEVYAGGQQIFEDIKSVFPGGSPADKNIYDREIKKYRVNDASLEEKNPVSSFAGSLLGYAAPGGVIAKGVRSARGVVGLAPQAASLLGQSSILGTEGAVMGALERPSTDQDIGNLPERLDNALVGGTIGAAIPYGIEGIKKGFKAIPTIAKKTMAILGGVSEDNISTFLKDPDRYLNAKPRDEVLTTITGLVDDINTKVDDGKLSVKDAKEGLRWAGQQIKETASENHAIARDQLRQAEQRLSDKFRDSVNDLKAKPAPTQLQGQIDDTLRGMKEENIKASGESFDILQGEIGAREKALGDSGRVKIRSLDPESQKRLSNFSNRFSNDKNIKKSIENAQNSKKGPYVSDENIKEIGWAPNYAAEPTGTIGHKGIGTPNPMNKNIEPDPFMWAENKYQSTRRLISKHKDQGIPLEINTSSDYIAKSDVIEELPKNSTVNMHMLTKDDYLNKILFPGNPSRRRQEVAIKVLEEAGIKVNKIEPTAQTILDSIGEKKVRSQLWKSQLKDQGEPISKKTMTFEILDILKSKIDDAENKSLRLVKEPAKESIEALEKTVVDDIEPPRTTINVRGVYSSLKTKVKELSQRNSADAKAAVKDLNKYMDDIKAKTADPDGNPTWWLDAAEAKRIIQDLDSDVKSWDSSKIAGQFDDKYNQTMKQVRYKLDDKLKKEFPEYRKKMSEIAERSKLLSETSKRFGKPELAFSRLSNIASDKAKFDRELLSKLGKYTGQDLDTPIADYVKTQKMLKDPKQLESLKRSLPEFDQLTDAQKLEKLALLDKSPKTFRSKLSKSPSFKELKMAQKDFDAALVDKDKIKGWTKSTVDGKLNAVMRGKTYVRGQLETLGKMSNQDLVKMVDDLKVSEAFEKEFRIGSRNVNLFTALGMGFIGGGPIGLIVGAATGAMVDRYGPALTKKILIATSKVQGSPSVQKLSKLGLPKSIAQELTDSFYASLIGGAIQENKKQTVIKNKGEAKWAQDGMRNIELFAQQKEDLDILSQIQKLDQTDPEVKKLLIEASDFKPGTIGFQKVIDKLNQLKTKGK